MTPILPGSTIGVLGSGQLGRMFGIAARRMGYRVHTLSPDKDSPTGQIADLEIQSPYEDLDAIRAFARQVDVVTFEFENVPSATAEAAEAFAPVRPNGGVLHITQNRLREKTFLAENGFPVTPFEAVSSEEELRAALSRTGYPAILKTAGFGYDGKGQQWIRAEEDTAGAWEAMGGQAAVLEAVVDFEREISVIGARGADGRFVAYAPIENAHRNGILDVSFCPAALPWRVSKQATDLARAILSKLEVVGVLCVEMFFTKDRKLVVNELAPRPHNSGHLTFDACVTSQFEQQLRAICGLPLGSTKLMNPAGMANLLGDLWNEGEPEWMQAYQFPNVKVHLYGKAEARPGRKMGHLTAIGSTALRAAETARMARRALRAARPASELRADSGPERF